MRPRVVGWVGLTLIAACNAFDPPVDSPFGDELFPSGFASAGAPPFGRGGTFGVATGAAGIGVPAGAGGMGTVGGAPGAVAGMGGGLGGLPAVGGSFPGLDAGSELPDGSAPQLPTDAGLSPDAGDAAP